MLKNNRYQYYYYYPEKLIDFDPKYSQNWAILDPIWTRFGPGSGPRVRVRIWTRVPGSQTRVWTLYPETPFLLYVYCAICDGIKSTKSNSKIKFGQFRRQSKSEVSLYVVFKLNSWPSKMQS